MEQMQRNKEIAGKLEEAATVLSQQGANPFRVNAYRAAARALLTLERDVGDIIESEGLDGLIALPTIGKGIASAIWEMVSTGRWTQLERLRGALDPVALLRSVPGLGPELAERIHDQLHVDTLEQLEAAAHDGRLEGVPGIGPRRLEALRAVLAVMLGRPGRPPSARAPTDGPDIALLLQVDRVYRRQAAAGELPKIAPKRFNPSGEAWLPILHHQQDSWHFTALYSNTARAHQLDKTGDWVVVYFYDDHHQEGQHTVVTETRGSLAGRRVVRGREAECRSYYEPGGNTAHG